MFIQKIRTFNIDEMDYLSPVLNMVKEGLNNTVITKR
jgi:hypothetical protein